LLFNTNHMQGTLDFSSEHWAPFILLWSTSLHVCDLALSLPN